MQSFNIVFDGSPKKLLNTKSSYRWFNKNCQQLASDKSFFCLWTFSVSSFTTKLTLRQKALILINDSQVLYRTEYCRMQLIIHLIDTSANCITVDWGNSWTDYLSRNEMSRLTKTASSRYNYVILAKKKKKKKKKRTTSSLHGPFVPNQK